ncbi:MAG: Fic family protein, partial [Oscillospiraceae bacterium]|nr:Fic family protein [Oscillospiraceae bacterium]
MQEYSYYYEGANFYRYPNTTVLINKFGIKDDDKLNEVERKLTQVKAVELINHPIKGKFDFKHFCKIHKFLFEDVYEWAGKERQGGFMSKGGTVFARSEFIESMFSEYYEKLEKDNFLKGLSKERFCEKLAYYMAEVNTIHPFREGNGRTTKIYFEQLSEQAGFDLDFSTIDK